MSSSSSSSSSSAGANPPVVAPPKGLVEDGKFQAIYEVPTGWHVPASFAMKTYPGAEEILLLGETNLDRRLITTWKDEDAFRQTAQSAFEGQLGLTAPSYAGYNIQRLAVQSRWAWVKRHYAILVTAVAVLSNIESLRMGVWNMFRRPNAFATPVARKIIAIAGVESDLDIRVQNRSGGPSAITISAITISDVKKQPAKLEGVTVTGLPWEGEVGAHGRETVPLRFVVGRPQTFFITPIGTAHAGWVQPNRALEAKSAIEIDVWPVIDYSPVFEIAGQTKIATRLRITFKHGAPPETLNYHCTLRLDNGWSVAAMQSELPAGHADQMKDTATVKWTAKTSPKKAQSFYITVNHPATATNHLQQLNPQVYPFP